MIQVTSSQTNNKCKIIYLAEKKTPNKDGYLFRNNSLSSSTAKKDLPGSESPFEHLSNVRLWPNKTVSFWNVFKKDAVLKGNKLRTSSEPAASPLRYCT